MKPFVSALKFGIVFFLLTISSARGGDAQVELTLGDETFVGKPVAHDQQISWLARTDGSYRPIFLQEVTSFRKHPKSFAPESPMTMRTRIQRELGKSYEVAIKGKFVVAGPPGRAKSYAELLDRVSREFSRYTSLRKLPAKGIEYPLLVQIFSDRSAFDKYCQTDDVAVSGMLRGYYNPATNRIALYEGAGRAVVASSSSGGKSPVTAYSQLDQETVKTLIHEGIHQLAFNVGLHSRIGPNPRWVVEGLAEMMEGNRQLNLSIERASSSVNQMRLEWFLQYRNKSRKETIADFITNEDYYFATNTLNAYSQAWALTYFLAETRSSSYANYLKRVSSRDPLAQNYSAEARLQDFQAEFGSDIGWLEVQFLRFIDGLQAK